MDKFFAEYKKATAKQNNHLSQVYKRILAALSKYPLPIWNSNQANSLEGVGDNTAKMFHQFIEERGKEFEIAQESSGVSNEENKYSEFQKINKIIISK